MPTNFGNKKIIFIAISILIIFALIGTGVFIGKNFNQDKQSAQPVQEEIKTDSDKVVPPLAEPAKKSAPPLGIEWIQDINTGIYLKNPEPTDGESITWSAVMFKKDNINLLTVTALQTGTGTANL